MCALLDTLAPGQPVPVDPPVGVSGLSHRSVLDVLRRLEPWLESGPGGYRLRAAVEGHATAEIDLQDLRMARLRLVLATDEANALLDPNGWPARLFGASCDMAQTARQGGLSVVQAARYLRPVTGAAALVQHLVDHPAATVVSSLREALIRGRARKPRMRGVQSRYPDLEAHRDARAADLPRHVRRRITELLGDLAAGGA